MARNIDVMYMSQSNEWSTPQDFFDGLNEEFHFDLDPCADETNHKCEKYFTKEDDGLSQNWGGTESFATLLTVARLANGLRNLIERDAKITRLLSC